MKLPIRKYKLTNQNKISTSNSYAALETISKLRLVRSVPAWETTELAVMHQEVMKLPIVGKEESLRSLYEIEPTIICEITELLPRC